MVQAHALKERALSVEVEAIGLPLRIPDAKRRLVHILGAVFRHHHGAGYVHLGGRCTPEARLLQEEGLFHLTAGIYLLQAVGFGHHVLYYAARLRLFVKDAGFYPDRLRLVGLEGKAEGYVAIGPCRDIAAPMGYGSLFR